MLGIFLDTETNGLNTRKHHVIEIAYKIIDVFTGELKDQFESIIALSPAQWEGSDLESLRVNGFTWEKVITGAPLAIVSDQIRRSFENSGIQRGAAVFICQNPSFDRAFFAQLIDTDEQEAKRWPYHWLDLASMYWAQAIKNKIPSSGKFPWETGCSKDKIAVALGLPKERNPHRAMNGVDHLLLCYESVVGFPGKSNNS